MKKEKITAGILIALCCIGAVMAGRSYFRTHPKPPKINRENIARSLGDPKADVWVVDYTDFACERCAAAHEVLGRHYRQHPSRVFWQVRFNPMLNRHRNAFLSARYALCAAKKGKFWAYAESLYRTQDQWKALPDPSEFFTKLGRSAGIDGVYLSDCARTEAIAGAVMTDKAESRELGITEAPIFFVNGKMVSGPNELDEELGRIFSESKSS